MGYGSQMGSVEVTYSKENVLSLALSLELPLYSVLALQSANFDQSLV